MSEHDTTTASSDDQRLHGHLIGVPGSRRSLNTPVLVIDVDALDTNIAAMAAAAGATGMTLRPHAKTHKSVEIARRQIAAGAAGVCCAKLGEAEVLAAAGIGGLLITSPVVSAPAIERLVALDANTEGLLVTVDHPDAVDALAAAAGAAGRRLALVVDVDPGVHRTGVAGAAEAVGLARRIQDHPSLRYAGVQFYCGIEQHIEDFAERRETITARTAQLRTVLDDLAAAGAPAPLVTGGGTGSHRIDIELGVLTELQVGSYIFMDREYLDCDLTGAGGRPFATALMVDARVVSANAAGLATVDAGIKSFAVEGGVPSILAGAPLGARYAFMGDEHGAVIGPDRATTPLNLDALVTFVVPHCDPTVNLYDSYHVVRGDTLVDIWPVFGAGPFALTTTVGPMDFGLPADDDERRRAVREWLADHPQPSGRQLAEAGFVAPHWPRPWGLDADPVHQLIIDDELRRAGVRRPQNPIGIGWAGPTLVHAGTAGQCRRYLPPLLAGDEIWCQLFSEPGAGSDLAGLSTRAVRDGDEWVVDGQKVWTSLAHDARFGILLARTEPDAGKHRGITYFICPMDAPGVEIRPIVDMAGMHTFNEVFLTGVRLPAANVVGDPGDGWRLAKVTLGNERVSLSGEGALWGMGPTAGDLLDGVRAAGPLTDPVLRQHAARVHIESEILRLIRLRTVSAAVRGLEPGPEASVRKVLADEHGQHVMALSKDLAGAGGLVAGGPERAVWDLGFLFAPALTIGGGTGEVQRNIIAERVLGLPHEGAGQPVPGS